MKKKINIRAQHEIAGFVLIVLIVSIIGVVFLSIAFRGGEVNRHSSVEISKLLESSMYYTTDCAINYIPQYRDVQDLIKECYKDQEGSHRKCLIKKRGLQSYSGSEISRGISSGKKFFLSPRQGPWEHIPGNLRGGTASAPLLILSRLKEGEEIKITDIEGKIEYVNGYHDCKSDDGTYGFAARAGFYNDNYELIGTEYNLRDFENGIIAPSGATELYAYVRETYEHRKDYQDNTGSCIFSLESKGAVIDKDKDSIKTENLEVETERGDVCETLERNLKNLLDTSLDIKEGHVNRAYKLDIYYSYAYENSPNEEILSIYNGVFSNCSFIVGGYHPIYVSSFSSGEISVDLLVCKS